MADVVLCKTKAGKGFKICVGDIWYYSSLGEVFKMLNNKAGAAHFRGIEELQLIGTPAVQPAGSFNALENPAVQAPDEHLTDVQEAILKRDDELGAQAQGDVGQV